MNAVYFSHFQASIRKSQNFNADEVTPTPSTEKGRKPSDFHQRKGKILVIRLSQWWEGEGQRSGREKEREQQLASRVL